MSNKNENTGLPENMYDVYNVLERKNKKGKISKDEKIRLTFLHRVLFPRKNKLC